MSITGLLWARKGWPDALKQVRVTADTDSQRVRYQPFTNPDWRSVYGPEAVAIETSDGKSIKSRVNPRASFQGHVAETPWDDLHLAYFSGYAIWNYLNTPVSLRVVRASRRKRSSHGTNTARATPAKGDISGFGRDPLSRTGVSTSTVRA